MKEAEKKYEVAFRAWRRVDDKLIDAKHDLEDTLRKQRIEKEKPARPCR